MLVWWKLAKFRKEEVGVEGYWLCRNHCSSCAWTKTAGGWDNVKDAILIWYLIFSNYGTCWIKVMARGAELLVWSSTATLLWWNRPGPQLQAGPWPGPQTRLLQQLWPLHKVQKTTRFCSAQPLCWPFTPVQGGYQFLAVSFPVFHKCFSQMFRVRCSTTTEKAADVYLAGGFLRLCSEYIATWGLPWNLLSSLQLE